MEKQLENVLEILMKGVSGKTWKGKEAILQSLASVVSACSSQIQKLPENSAYAPKKIVGILCKECKRSDKDYKRHAVLALSKVLEALKVVDVFDEVKELLFELSAAEEQKDVPPEDKDPKDKPLTLLIRGAAFAALGNAWPLAPATQAANVPPLMRLLITSIPTSTWNIRIEILNSIKKILRKTYPNILTSEIVKQLLPPLYETLNDLKYSAVRSAALGAITELVDATEGSDLLEPHLNEMNQQLLSAEGNDSELKDKITALRQTLQDHPTKKRKQGPKEQNQM
jgi:hypothetical protein